MTEPRSPALVDEAQQYLALVDLFRAEGYEPQWRTEQALFGRGERERRET